MINSQHGFPGRRAVAGITHVGGSNVIGGLSDGGKCADATCTAVATGTGAKHVCMIHRHDRFPCHCAMTRFANLGRFIVVESFAGGRVAVVTA